MPRRAVTLTDLEIVGEEDTDGDRDGEELVEGEAEVHADRVADFETGGEGEDVPAAAEGERDPMALTVCGEEAVAELVRCAESEADGDWDGLPVDELHRVDDLLTTALRVAVDVPRAEPGPAAVTVAEKKGDGVGGGGGDNVAVEKSEGEVVEEAEEEGVEDGEEAELCDALNEAEEGLAVPLAEVVTVAVPLSERLPEGQALLLTVKVPPAPPPLPGEEEEKAEGVPLALPLVEALDEALPCMVRVRVRGWVVVAAPVAGAEAEAERVGGFEPELLPDADGEPVLDTVPRIVREAEGEEEEWGEVVAHPVALLVTESVGEGECVLVAPPDTVAKALVDAEAVAEAASEGEIVGAIVTEAVDDFDNDFVEVAEGVAWAVVEAEAVSEGEVETEGELLGLPLMPALGVAPPLTDAALLAVPLGLRTLLLDPVKEQPPVCDGDPLCVASADRLSTLEALAEPVPMLVAVPPPPLPPPLAVGRAETEALPPPVLDDVTVLVPLGRRGVGVTEGEPQGEGEAEGEGVKEAELVAEGVLLRVCDAEAVPVPTREAEGRALTDGEGEGRGVALEQGVGAAALAVA